VIGEQQMEAVPDVAEPLRGFRIWHWGEVLLSQNGEPWVPGDPLKASCPHHTTCPAPADDHFGGPSCGIYAFKTLQDCVRQFWGARALWGEVLLWGSTYDHAHGYRAEYAEIARVFRRPTGLLTAPAWYGEKKLQRVGDLYGVSVDEWPLTPAETIGAVAGKRVADRLASASFSFGSFQRRAGFASRAMSSSGAASATAVASGSSSTNVNDGLDALKTLWGLRRG